MDEIRGHNTIDVYLPTYRMEPAEEEKFYPSKAKKIVEDILNEELGEFVFNEEEAKNLILIICDKVRDSIRDYLGKDSRYKIVVQSTITQLKDQGLHIGSRCLWDGNFDNYASCQFQNATTHCCCIVFCLYTD